MEQQDCIVKRSIQLSIASLLLCSCILPAYNQKQYYTVKKKLDCYKSLISELTETPRTTELLEKTRDVEVKESLDPVATPLQYRLIHYAEFSKFLSNDWIVQCKEHLQTGNDLRGIRYLSPTHFIIEIDAFTQSSYDNQVNDYKEIHRLIYLEQYVPEYFGLGDMEYLIHFEELEDNWYYEITHIPS